jgi:hypothetical protein
MWMTSPPSNLAPPSPTATTTVLPSAAADRQTPPVSDPRVSGDLWPLVERAVILRFVRDGFIIRTPGVAIWNSSVSRFFDLNRNFISESDFNVSALSIGSARERSAAFKFYSARELDVGWTEFFWVEPNVLARPISVDASGSPLDMDPEFPQFYQWRTLLGLSPILFIEARL